MRKCRFPGCEKQAWHNSTMCERLHSENENLIKARQRAQAPASPLDRRFGKRPVARPQKPAQPYAARPMDATANAKANGTNRSYSYETAEETWLNGRKG